MITIYEIGIGIYDAYSNDIKGVHMAIGVLIGIWSFCFTVWVNAHLAWK